MQDSLTWVKICNNERNCLIISMQMARLYHSNSKSTETKDHRINGSKRYRTNHVSCADQSFSCIFLFMQIMPDKCVQTSFGRHLIMSYCIALWASQPFHLLCRHSNTLWLSLPVISSIAHRRWMCNTCKLVPLFTIRLYPVGLFHIWTIYTAIDISIEISLIIWFWIYQARSHFFDIAAADAAVISKHRLQFIFSIGIVLICMPIDLSLPHEFNKEIANRRFDLIA